VKLSKKQLKKIIQEEIQNVLQEQTHPAQSTVEFAEKAAAFAKQLIHTQFGYDLQAFRKQFGKGWGPLYEDVKNLLFKMAEEKNVKGFQHAANWMSQVQSAWSAADSDAKKKAGQRHATSWPRGSSQQLMAERFGKMLTAMDVFIKDELKKAGATDPRRGY